jgi:UDP-N-acetylmuramoyl-tripeptide--D-alanyl-D-alanine ligase
MPRVVLTAAATTDAVRAALKELAEHARSADPRGRSWAVVGELTDSHDAAISTHDAVGRLAVRLDVSRFIVVGTGRPMRAMHQGAVMEGSWGSEALLVDDVSAARTLLDDELDTADVVLLAGTDASGLPALAADLQGATG